MRILILLILFLEFSKAIIVFRDKKNIKIVSLGEYNSESKLKVFKHNKIVFVNTKSLKQSDQYNAEEFIKFLDDNKLSFQSVLDDKWNIEIYRDKFYIKTKEQKIFRTLDLSIYYYVGNSTGFYCAFKTKNNEIHGFITYKYEVIKNRYSIDLKIKENIFSAPLTIKYHKE